MKSFDFGTLIARYSAEFPFTDAISEDLIRQLASAKLRLLRCEQMEQAAFSQNEANLKELKQLDQYRRSTESSYHKAYKLLAQKLATRTELERREASRAAFLANYEIEACEKIQNEPNFTPQPISSNKVGRNQPCPCGSNRRHKFCCLNKKAQAAA